MPYFQIYETTVVDREHRLALNFLVVPASAVLEERKRVLGNLDATAESLGALVHLRTNSSEYLPHILAAILAEEDASRAATQLVQMLNVSPIDRAFDGLSPDIVTFARYASFEKVVPFEESPPFFRDLASIIAKVVNKNPELAIGSLIGAVASGPTPFIILTVPAGIVLVYAAQGFGQGLRDRAQRLWA